MFGQHTIAHKRDRRSRSCQLLRRSTRTKDAAIARTTYARGVARGGSRPAIALGTAWAKSESSRSDTLGFRGLGHPGEDHSVPVLPHEHREAWNGVEAKAHG